MATVLKINWVDGADAPDSRQLAGYIGGSSRQFHWKHSQKEAISHIEKGVFDYYVVNNARLARLKVGIAPDGCKYLKIDADAEYPLHLLQLPNSPTTGVALGQIRVPMFKTP